jgi:hypothetical protein
LIYTFLAQHAINDYQPYPGKEVIVYHQKGRSTPHTTASIRRQDLGLLQVNRQLRQEYSPIYSKYTKIYISLHNLGTHAKDLKPHEQLVLPAGNVFLGIHNWLNEIPRGTDAGIDIMPRIQAIEYSPPTELTYTFNAVKTYYISVLFSVRNNDPWWACLQTQIQSLVVHPETPSRYTSGYVEVTDEETLTMVVGTAYAAPWMSSSTTALQRQKSTHRHGKRDAWLHRVRLSKLCTWNRFRICREGDVEEVQ